MLNRRAQSVAEYAVFISMMIAAIAMIQTYIKRGLQGRYADGADQLVEGIDSLNAADLNPGGWTDISDTVVTKQMQYEPTEVSSRKTQTVLEDRLNYKMEKGGKITREIIVRTNQSAGDFQEYGYTP